MSCNDYKKLSEAYEYKENYEWGNKGELTFPSGNQMPPPSAPRPPGPPTYYDKDYHTEDERNWHHRYWDADHHRYWPKIIVPVPYAYQDWMTKFWNMINDISINYPEYPTLTDIQGMKNFILSLPTIIPCQTDLCNNYIKNFIDRNRDNLDAIVSNRSVLYGFLHDFYQDINQKFGSEILSNTKYIVPNNYYYNYNYI